MGLRIVLILQLLLRQGVTLDYYDQPCGDIYTDIQSGTIRLPTSQNGKYFPLMDCRWEIVAPAGHTVVVVSSNFAVEESANCQWDNLEIREGNESVPGNRFCGYQNVAYLSSAPTIYIYFTSDGFYQEAGFTLDFYIMDTNSQELSMCNKTVAMETYITSPNYPSNYPSNAICLYKIQAPSGQQVEVTVEDIEFEEDTCLHDSLEFFSGETNHNPSLGRACHDGPTAQTVFTSSQNTMFIVFSSDYFQERKGFRAYVRFKDSNIPDQVTEKDCDVVIANDAEGVVHSPNYPYSYPSNKNCTIVIRSPLQDHRIRLNITFLEIEESENCSFDHLSVFVDERKNSEEVAKLCGYLNKSNVFHSRSESMRLEFVSDDLISGQGFEAKFMIIPKGACYPVCQAGTVCVYQDNIHRCTKGSECPINICGNGTCVMPGKSDNSITIQCYCVEGFTGTFCDQQLNKQQEQLTLIKYPENRSVRRGSNLVLECQVNDPTAEYTWLLEDLLLQSDGAFVEVYSGGVLELRNFQEDLEGLYTCLASTPTKYAKHQFRLSLMESCNIVIEFPPRNKTVNVGDSALFSCFVPTATVSWSKDGRVIPGQDTKSKKVMGDGFYLKIENAQETDQGFYTCRAESLKGCFVERHAYLTVLKPDDNDLACGRVVMGPMAPPELSSRISGGDRIKPASAPWHVTINENRSGKTFCGGTIVSKKWIITAAHCFMRFQEKFKEPFHPSKVSLVIGTDMCNGVGGVMAEIESYIVHPQFARRAVYDNDIALIEVGAELNFTNTVQPICLKSLDFVNNAFLQRKVGRKAGRVVGCGQMYENVEVTPTHLRDVIVPTVSREKCENADIGRGNFTDTMFCAGYDRALFGDACFGDSGGSLTMSEPPFLPWVLVGVVSWGVGCDRQGHYGYYTNVAHFYDWIQNVTKDNHY